MEETTIIIIEDNAEKTILVVDDEIIMEGDKCPFGDCDKCTNRCKVIPCG